MQTAKDDALSLSDHAWDRLANRMDGLTDIEWAWCPDEAAPQISIRWRLEHLTTTLTEPRVGSWLGSRSTVRTELPAATSASSARVALAAAYTGFREVVAAADLDQEIGKPAGPYGSATRYSFVLHIADELIHHGAEAALLRDLYSRHLFQ